MWNKIGEFLTINWLNILLVVVGGFALLIYWLQERRKVSEAASLIVMQIEDLQKSMRVLKTYISDNKLNSTAFYESQILFRTDYWDKYKHYFIRKIDSFSFNNINEFYACASEVVEQQELMKNLQKNDFFVNQNILAQMEANLILQTNTAVMHSCDNRDKAVEEMINTVPENFSKEQKEAIENMKKQFCNLNNISDFNLFLQLYNKDKKTIIDAFNNDAFTNYIPVQIEKSLTKALSQFDSITVIGCEGYNKLKKIAKRSF